MFTQPCFIRKNTPELRKKLEELGYRQQSEEFYEFDFLIINHPICDFEDCGDGFGLHSSVDEWMINEHPRIYEDCIDCGTNEQLFLALAALRDIGGYLQWYINDNTGEWVFCKCDRRFACRLDRDMLRKATPSEILKKYDT